jgi:hypothetical protein
MGVRGVLRVIENEMVGFWCPGCEEIHVISVAAGGWFFNGDYDTPTFSPSILVSGGHYASGWIGPNCWCTFNLEHPENRFKCSICHSFVKNGMIEFLGDCTHSLAGQTVTLALEEIG